MNIEETELKKFILDSGLISRSDMEDAENEARQKKVSVGEILVNHGRLSADDLRRAQAHVSGISFISLKGRHIDFDTMSLIPEPIARKHNVMVFDKTEDGIEVAMLSVNDLHAIDFLRGKSDNKVSVNLTDIDSIKSALLKYQKGLKTHFGDLMKRDTSAESLVDTLLRHAILQHASDIHIEPQEKEISVRYRIHGSLHEAMILPKSSGASIVARIKGLASLKIDGNNFPQEGRFKVEMKGEKISLRVSMVPTFYGEKTAISLVKDNPSGLTLEQLGFHGVGLELVHDAMKSMKGTVLVVGPKGSGKFETLYSLIEGINTPKVNISTIEDPIKSQIPRVNQIQVRPDIGFSFAKGLRSLLRQDSDVIMVGEMDTAETASLATNAAVTGHFILSTLPSRSAALALAHLLDIKIEPLLVSSTVSVVIGQRLARKLNTSAVRKPLSRAELGALGKVVDLDRMLTLLRAEKVIGAKDSWGDVLFGSPKVTPANDGYDGVIGIHEVLKVTSTISNLIMKGATSAEIDARAKKEGMVSLLEDGIFKAAQGLTTVEEVLRVLSK